MKHTALHAVSVDCGAYRWLPLSGMPYEYARRYNAARRDQVAHEARGSGRHASASTAAGCWLLAACCLLPNMLPAALHAQSQSQSLRSRRRRYCATRVSTYQCQHGRKQG